MPCERRAAAFFACFESAACDVSDRGWRPGPPRRALDLSRTDGACFTDCPFSYSRSAVLRVFSKVVPFLGGGRSTPARRALGEANRDCLLPIARRAFPFGYVPSPRVRTPPPQWSAPCLPVSPFPQASQSFLGRSYKVFLLAPARGELTRRCPSAAINPAPTAAPIPATTSQFVSSPALWRPSRVL